MKIAHLITVLLLQTISLIAHEEYTHKHINFYGCDVSYPMLEWQENKPFYTRRHNIDKKTIAPLKNINKQMPHY